MQNDKGWQEGAMSTSKMPSDKGLCEEKVKLWKKRPRVKNSVKG